MQIGDLIRENNRKEIQISKLELDRYRKFKILREQAEFCESTDTEQIHVLADITNEIATLKKEVKTNNIKIQKAIEKTENLTLLQLYFCRFELKLTIEKCAEKINYSTKQTTRLLQKLQAIEI